AANKFLKTLEEPPGDARIILLATDVLGLLETIRSRVQVLRFLPLSRERLVDVAAQRLGEGANRAQLEALAPLAAGSPGRLVQLVRDGFDAVVSLLRDRLVKPASPN